jgi:N-acetyl-gamma-glutamyl-phosphate reductase
MQKIRVGIIGAAGYTGGELIRILINHPDVEIVFAKSDSQGGKLVSTVHRDLAGESDLHFSEQFDTNIDVLFICTGHGQAKKFLEENKIPIGIRIIDLSQDFRLGETAGSRKFVYGLPELNKPEIQSANNIANPGCFATAIQLGLIPLVVSGKFEGEIHTSGITGSTGAGQSLSESSHFSYRQNNLSVYKVFQHQHLREIKLSLAELSNKPVPNILFVPYRGPFTRGIWITSYAKSSLTKDEAIKLYQDFYANHPFTTVVEAIDLKQVVNTNKCLIQIEKEGEHLLIFSIIDNLIKGASGQAVQNMNLMFGLSETEGLKLKSTSF